jgi:glucose-6-phosphate isomerase
MNSLDALAQMDAVERLRSHDASLFSGDPDVQARVANRLGWTHLGGTASPIAADLAEIVRNLKEDGTTDVLLLGMGGSSLAALVMAEALATPGSGFAVHVLDTTNPTTVGETLASLNPVSTAAIVASKSGTTIEPRVLFEVISEWMRAGGVDEPGSHFIALTDPGSELEGLASDLGFRTTMSTPADVGGRYSALTAFGLLPAATAGVDVAELLGRAQDMELRASSAAADNPAASLAAFIVDAQRRGADKLTLVMSPALRPLGLWIEQLVAESTGKEGTGVLPVVELTEDRPTGYGDDRAVVVVRFANDAVLTEWAEGERGRRPLLELELGDRYDLGAEFVRWEYAVALVGALLGINPFDEPNVAEAKKATSDVLAGTLTPLEAQASVGDVEIGYHGALEAPAAAPSSLSEALSSAIGTVSAGDYLAVLAYLPDDDELLRPLARAVPSVSAATGRAVTLELGPRYLHSTGQLHKGGPAAGTFIVITTRDDADIDLTGRDYSLAELHRAQAQGDVITLAAHARPVLQVDLADSSARSIAQLGEALSDDAVLAP